MPRIPLPVSVSCHCADTMASESSVVWAFACNNVVAIRQSIPYLKWLSVGDILISSFMILDLKGCSHVRVVLCKITDFMLNQCQFNSFFCLCKDKTSLFLSLYLVVFVVSAKKRTS